MKELLYNAAKKAGIELSDEQLNKFETYYEMLIEKNKVMNLTSITEMNDVVMKHFVDSISIKKYSDLSGKKIIDIGTGAGFPGIPLAIVFEDAQFTLMDSLNKRIQFLNEVIEAIELKNVETVHDRAEELARKEGYREKYNYCVSRAVANMSTLLEYCIPFVKKGGKFISYKSGAVKEELEASVNAQKKLGCKFAECIEFTLPDTDISRTFVVFDKVNFTGKAYPRQAGKPKKNPL